MTHKISTLQIRQRLGDILNRVALRHDQFIIERKGKPVAALVPVEKLEQIEQFSRRQVLDVLNRQKGGGLTQEEADRLADSAKHRARREATTSGRKRRHA